MRIIDGLSIYEERYMCARKAVHVRTLYSARSRRISTASGQCLRMCFHVRQFQYLHAHAAPHRRLTLTLTQLNTGASSLRALAR